MLTYHISSAGENHIEEPSEYYYDYYWPFVDRSVSPRADRSSPSSLNTRTETITYPNRRLAVTNQQEAGRSMNEFEHRIGHDTSQTPSTSITGKETTHEPMTSTQYFTTTQVPMTSTQFLTKTKTADATTSIVTSPTTSSTITTTSTATTTTVRNRQQSTKTNAREHSRSNGRAPTSHNGNYPGWWIMQKI